jgi:hypothetical protein
MKALEAPPSDRPLRDGFDQTVSRFSFPGTSGNRRSLLGRMPAALDRRRLLMTDPEKPLIN